MLFIAVGTPSPASGAADPSVVQAVAEQLRAHDEFQVESELILDLFADEGVLIDVSGSFKAHAAARHNITCWMP